MPLIDRHDSPRQLHIMTSDEFSSWQKTASPMQKAWVDDHGFAAQKNTSLVLPSSEGHIEGAIIGAGASDYVSGAMASRLPQGAYQIPGDTPEQLALGFALDQYQYDRFKPSSSKPKADLVIADSDQFKRLSAIVAGVNLTRDLINAPANYLTPPRAGR